ncbi:hypothetical protein F2Q70_00021344 [Brassica cretica]|uniref:RRM domain-containing protein n=1 Tax=Brassica cretica TaxID=69181 RepID=A0A8S9GTY2_BRACR|nr:hypothetical protein F2Q70_00021344 [Brassica cretica]
MKRLSICYCLTVGQCLDSAQLLRLPFEDSSWEGQALKNTLVQSGPMVGPGEVDDELEEEVGSECGKYGTVTRVLIFEITEANFSTHEAVRIFVQFSRPEETTKALVDLDGRFFGGRTVRATFYDEVKFSKNELAPVPGEIPGY